MFNKVHFVFLGLSFTMLKHYAQLDTRKPQRTVQALQGDVWYKASGAWGQAGRASLDCSSPAKLNFKGTRIALGFLEDTWLRSLESPGLEQHSCEGSPVGIQPQLRLLTLWDIPASCNNLPLLRKTLGNLIRLSAFFIVCFKEKVFPT